jgi:AraC-like DNA-binding protein
VSQSSALVATPADSGLSILETRYSAGSVLATHYHALASLSLVFQGGQLERVGHRSHECVTRSAVFKTAEIDHSDHVGSTGMHGLFIELSRPTEAAFRAAVGRPVDVGCFTDAATRALVQRVEGELRQRHPGFELVVQGLVHELLGSLVRSGRSRAARRSRVWLQGARDYLEAHFRDAPSLAALASEVGVHPSHLAQAFHAEYGLTIGEWVRARRVEHARVALLDPTVPIALIAVEAGFADQSHLTRLFRARLGVTPGAYRRQMTRAADRPPRSVGRRA